MAVVPVHCTLSESHSYSELFTMASLPSWSTPQQRHVPADAQHPSHVTANNSSVATSTSLSSSSPLLSHSATEPPPEVVAGAGSVLLNDTSANAPEPHTGTEPPAVDAPAPETTASGAKGEVNEPRKCWICFSDETEDTPLSSEWRSPCRCALTAHEACLLDWIADLQAPSSRKSTGANAEIRCPQCKSEIIMARPRDVIVDTVSSAERFAGRLVVPGIISVFAGCIWTGCLAYGMNTVYVIFGTEEASRILTSGVASRSHNTLARTANDTLTLARVLFPFTPSYSGWNWRLGIGLPLVPVALVLSRTTLADSILPIAPILFLASHISEGEKLDVTHWPPSAAMTVAVLPYIRGAYNELYERMFGERVRRWAREVQPRAGEGEEGGTNQPGPGAAGDHFHEMRGEEVLMEIALEVDVVPQDGDDDEDEQPQAGAAPRPDGPVADAEGHAAAAPADDEPADADNHGPAGAAEEDGEPAAAPIPAIAHIAAPAPIQRANNLVISTGQVADTIIGALLFPAVSSLMGSLLKRILPRSWTTPAGPWDRRFGGILQAKWGRSIVGGCLFVVLKDAVVLYARWKQAQIHRKRRVLDWDKGRGRREGRLG